MEALWHLEDKWKLSTQKTVALFACTSLLVIGLCVVGALKRKSSSSRSGSVHQEPSCKDTWGDRPPAAGRRPVVEVLMGCVRWSGASKWEEGSRGSQREVPTPLLAKRDGGGHDAGWQSHNSTSAVWQKPILMGEKCELPRFSGLILYDQRGMPLHHCAEESHVHVQEESAPGVRTTLKDLL